MTIQKFYQLSDCFCGSFAPLYEDYAPNGTLRIVTCGECWRAHVEFEKPAESSVSNESYAFPDKVIMNDLLQRNDLRASARG